MTNSLLVQGIGLIAVLISLCIFQTNKRKNMLRLGAAASVLYVVHFYLLGAYTGSAMNAVGGTRSYVYSKVTPSRRNLWILLLFTTVAITATIITWQGYISILPLLGSSGGAIAYWQSDPKIIRRLAMIASPLWFTYNAISGSYPGMAIEVIMLTSNLVGQYRFDVKAPDSIAPSELVIERGF